MRAGVAGQLSPDSVMAAVINRGGNKLDQYLSVGTDLTMQTQGKRTLGTLTVHLRNNTPPGSVAVHRRALSRASGPCTASTSGSWR